MEIIIKERRVNGNSVFDVYVKRGKQTTSIAIGVSEAEADRVINKTKEMCNDKAN